MSTLVEIQQAIVELADDEKEALAAWLTSQKTPAPSPGDERELLESLDRGVRDLDEGKGVALNEARKLVRISVGK